MTNQPTIQRVNVPNVGIFDRIVYDDTYVEYRAVPGECYRQRLAPRHWPLLSAAALATVGAFFLL